MPHRWRRGKESSDERSRSVGRAGYPRGRSEYQAAVKAPIRGTEEGLGAPRSGRPFVLPGRGSPGRRVETRDNEGFHSRLTRPPGDFRMTAL